MQQDHRVIMECLEPTMTTGMWLSVMRPLHRQNPIMFRSSQWNRHWRGWMEEIILLLVICRGAITHLHSLLLPAAMQIISGPCCRLIQQPVNYFQLHAMEVLFRSLRKQSKESCMHSSHLLPVQLPISLLTVLVQGSQLLIQRQRRHLK